MRTLNTVMIDADSETQEGGSEGMVQVCQHQRVYRQLDELDHELRCMQRSPSWRITQFLRNKKALMGCLLSWVPFVSHTLSFVREENGSFSVRSNRKLLPNSWVSLQVTQSDLSGTLYIDRGDGFLEHDSMPLDIGRGQSCLIKLPALVRGMRFDSGEALIEPIRVTQLYSFLPFITAVTEYGLTASLYQFSRGGLAALRQALFHSMHTRAVLAPCYKKQIYDRWISTREERSALEGNVDSSILISLVMPVFNTAPWLLDLAVQSVIDQTYENWELCIVDDGSLRPSTIECLAKYQAADSRIRVTRSEQNLDISAASNCALAMCKGDFVGLIDHDDILAPHALTRVAGCLGANKNLKLVFSDEDRITMSGERLEPYFKPGWNRLLLLEQNLVSHFGVYDRELLISIGGFREGLEGSQDWDLALRAAHKLRDSQIQHIPEVLYHWRIEPRSVSTSSVTQSRAVSAGIRAVREEYERLGVPTCDDRELQGRVRIAPLEATCGIIYRSGNQIVSGREFWDEEVVDLETDYLCVFHAESDTLVQPLVEQLLAVHQIPGVVASGGILLDDQGVTIDGLYAYKDSQFVQVNGLYNRVRQDRYFGSRRSVGLLSAFCFCASRKFLHDACAQSELPYSMSIALQAAELKSSLMLLPDVTHSLRSNLALPLAFQVGPEIKDLYNPHTAVEPAGGIQF